MLQQLPADAIYVVKDNRGVAAQLARLFTTVDIKTQVVDGVDAVPKNAQDVIYLAAINKDMTMDAAIDVNYAAFSLAHKLGRQFADKAPGSFISVQDTGGCFAIKQDISQQAWLTGLPALIKTARQEWGNVATKAIDIDCANLCSEDIAHRIFNEIMYGDDDIEVAIDSSGRRYITEYEDIDDSNGLTGFNTSGVILVTGGVRGVTAACLKHLATNTPGLKIAILARSRLDHEAAYLKDCRSEQQLGQAIFNHAKQTGNTLTPIRIKQHIHTVLAMREAQENIRYLQEAGAEVGYYQCDVVDQAQINQAIANIRQALGSITTLIHAAGVLQDKTIHEKTLQQFSQVFNTKVMGFKYLLEATSTDTLSHICCFTSIAAKEGNSGQADYAMANEVLNKLCQQQQIIRGASCQVSAINWGPWDGGMVTALLKQHFANRGVSMIPLQQGADSFTNLLSADENNVEYVVGKDLDAWRYTATATTRQVRIWLHHSQYPFVLDHQVWGKPLLPLVLIMELAYRLGNKVFSAAMSLNNIHVLSPMPLHNFSTCGDWLTLAYIRNDNRIACEFIDANTQKVCCKLDIVAQNNLAQVELSFEIRQRIIDTQEQTLLGKQQLYTDVLFHGASLQPISSINAFVDDQYLTASYKLNKANQTCGQYVAYSLIDGAMQLALAAVHVEYQKHALPTHIAGITIYSRPLSVDNMQGNYYLQILGHNDMQATGDLYIVGAKGNLLAQLSECRCFVVKSY